MRTEAETMRIIKILNDKQDRRCPVCDTEMSFRNAKGHINPKFEVKDDDGVGLEIVVCNRCNALVKHLRRMPRPTVDRALRLIDKYKLCL